MNNNTQVSAPGSAASSTLWPLALACMTLAALALDVSGQAGRLAFTVPCTVFALLLLLAHVVRLRGERASTAATLPGDAPAAAPTPAAPRPVGLWATTDAQGLCTAVSDQAAKCLGVTPDALLGQPVSQLLGPLHRDVLQQALQAAVLGAPQHLQLPWVGEAGRERRLQLLLAPLPAIAGAAAAGLPTSPGCSLLATDVTALQTALEAARNGERRLRIIMDQIPVTVSYIDADMRYRYINRAQRLWLGKEEAEVLDHPVREVVGDAVYADIEPRLRQALAGQEIALERQRNDRFGNPVWHSGRHVPDVDTLAYRFQFIRKGYYCLDKDSVEN